MRTPSPFWTSSAFAALLVAAALAGFLLYQEHEAHFWGALPYLLVLACPLMHMFMHRGHGGHRHGGSDHHEHRSDRQQ